MKNRKCTIALIILLFIFVFYNQTKAQISLSFSYQENTICDGNGCAYTGPTILINEVMFTPSPNDGSIYGTGPGWGIGSNEGEWIELYNPDRCKPIDISCYFLGNNTNEFYTGQMDIGAGYAIPQGTIVPPRGFVLLRGIYAPSVPSNLLVQNGGNTIEIIVNDLSKICLGGNSRLWFPNAGSWFAFYDKNGIPQDAISWNDTTYSYLFGHPCNPTTSGCQYTGTLASYNDIPTSNKTYVTNTNPGSTPNMSFRRMPDGASWALNTPATPTYGTCNSTCIPPPIITCNGTASVFPVGGTLPYTYLWDDTQTQMTSTATGLCEGTYCVTVTDANLIQQTACVYVPNHQPNVTFNNVAPVCFDAPSFNLTSYVSPSGGIFSGIDTSSSVFNPAVAGVGNHTITYIYTDSNTCADTAIQIVIVNPLPIAEAGTDQIICLDQNVNLTAYGGATYYWSNNSNSQSTNVSPSITTTYVVTVTDTNNCSATDNVQVTVKPLPPAEAGLNLAICYGDSTTLNASGGVNYVWNPTTSLSNPNIANPISSAIITTTYTVTVMGDNGCSASDNVVISVYPQIPAYAGLDQSICRLQESANLTASGGIAYNWNPTTGLSNPNVYNPTATPTSTTTYTIIVSDANACTATDNVIVTVNSIPTYTFTSDSVNCYSGTDGSINISPTGGIQPYSYTWNPMVSYDSAAINISAGLYYITVTDSNGCYAIGNIPLNQPAQLTLNTSGDVVICYGDSTVISTSSNGGTGNHSYFWDNGLGTGSSFTVNPTTTTIYTVSVTDANGCTATPLSLTVDVSPPISVNLSGIPTSMCLGGTSLLTATANGGNGYYTYTWGQGIGVSSQSVNVFPTLTTTYPVTVTDNCGSPQGVDSIEIIVYPLPIVDFSADLINGCQPLLVNFTDNSTPEIGTWLWNFGDTASGNDSISTLENPSHIFNLPGTYTISLTVSTTDGCTGSYTYQDMIEVYPLPVANFSYSPTDATMEAPYIYFIDLSINPYTWEWNFGDEESGENNFSTIQHPTHTFSNSGEYLVYLIVTTDHYCKDTAYNNIYIKDNFTFFAPNAITLNGDGLNDFFIPVGIGWQEGTFEMYIFDRWGEEIYSTKDLNKPWDGRLQNSLLAPIAVFTWYVKLNDFTGKPHTFTGRVTVVR